jgi:hypothetical protein
MPGITFLKPEVVPEYNILAGVRTETDCQQFLENMTTFNILQPEYSGLTQ